MYLIIYLCIWLLILKLVEDFLVHLKKKKKTLSNAWCILFCRWCYQHIWETGWWMVGRGVTWHPRNFPFYICRGVLKIHDDILLFSWKIKTILYGVFELQTARGYISAKVAFISCMISVNISYLVVCVRRIVIEMAAWMAG